MFEMFTMIFLATTAAYADPLEDARKAFNNCLVEAHNEAMKAKSSVPDFNKTAQDACPDQKKRYYDIIFSSERKYGSSAKEAEVYANEETQMIVDSMTRSFSQNLSNNATMVPEK